MPKEKSAPESERRSNEPKNKIEPKNVKKILDATEWARATYFIEDSLYLVVMGKGRAKWLYKGRKAGGSRTMVHVVCGYYPTTLVTEAKNRKNEAKKLLQQGINPNEQKREEKAKAARIKAEEQRTLTVVSAEYFKNKANELSAKTLQGDQGRFNNHIPDTLKTMPITKIRRADHLKPVIDALVRKGLIEQARRVASLIGRIFGYALDAGYIEASPAEHLVRMIPRQARGERNHLPATTDEAGLADLFRRVWQYCATGRSIPQMVAGIKLHCYLPIRNGDLRQALWENVDLENGTWFFPKTKNSRDYTIAITSQVKAILEDLRLYCTSKWLFPSGSSKSGHLTNEGMEKVLRLAGIPKESHCLHGFRSSFETICLEHGLPKTVTEQGMFHVAGGSVEMAYNRAKYIEPSRLILQWWADVVDALREGRPLPEVPARLAAYYR